MANQFVRNVIIMLAVLVTPVAAGAHVVLETQQASSGEYFKAVFAVPHGCDGSPTIALRVDLPPGVVIAKPMPKSGWTVGIRKEPLSLAVENEGHAITERVEQVTWQGGRLPDDEYDTYTIMVRLPDTPGRLYFPVRQVCETGETRWEEIPPAGKTSRDVRYPAPSVMVAPPDAVKPAETAR
jgi:periplasmic copper chaperone A